MTTPPALLAAITHHVATVGASASAARATRSWRAHPPLSDHAHPAAVAAAARAGGPAVQDQILVALLHIGGEWAELTALSTLAPRLGWIVAGWARRGAANEVADLEAELVARTLEAFRAAREGPPPGRPGLALVDRARGQTRTRRVTDLRRDRHRAPSADRPVAVSGDRRSGLDLLAAAVSEEFTSGRIGALPARALYLTRVAGYSSPEAAIRLGSTAGSVRTQRARAARHLAQRTVGCGLGEAA